jgi:hypothetical protein
VNGQFGSGVECGSGWLRWGGQRGDEWGSVRRSPSVPRHDGAPGAGPITVGAPCPARPNPCARILLAVVALVPAAARAIEVTVNRPDVPAPDTVTIWCDLLNYLEVTAVIAGGVPLFMHTGPRLCVSQQRMAAYRPSVCRPAQGLVTCYPRGTSGPWGRPNEDAIVRAKGFPGRFDKPPPLPLSRAW